MLCTTLKALNKQGITCHIIVEVRTKNAKDTDNFLVTVVA
jgi:hypothetical protein